tara:strand:+ start:1536 stop:1748 length:213 start_codon:yes stop_codon:yes gene_type:complete
MNTEQKEQKAGQFLGKVKRVQCSPLTEIDRFMVEELAEKFQTSESKIIGIALHEWLKTNFNSYELMGLMK